MVFPGIKWNEAIQGLSTLAAYEFQGWARTTTYIHTPGSYIVTCLGTLYMGLLIDLHERIWYFIDVYYEKDGICKR